LHFCVSMRLNICDYVRLPLNLMVETVYNESFENLGWDSNTEEFNMQWVGMGVCLQTNEAFDWKCEHYFYIFVRKWLPNDMIFSTNRGNLKAKIDTNFIFVRVKLILQNYLWITSFFLYCTRGVEVTLFVRHHYIDRCVWVWYKRAIHDRNSQCIFKVIHYFIYFSYFKNKVW
jgi:hypothetical protein